MKQREGKKEEELGKEEREGLSDTIYKALLELFLDFHTQRGSPHL